MDNLNKITKINFLGLLLAFVISTSIINAETLINKKFSNFNLELTENTEVTKLKITSDNKIDIKDLFDLEKPNRIVLDVNNLKLKSNKNLNTDNSNELTQIRLGKHSNKVRFVLDLKGNTIPKFNWSSENEKTLNLVINKNLDKKIVKKEVPTKVAINKEKKINKPLKVKELVKEKTKVTKQNIKNDMNAKSNLKIANTTNNVTPKKLTPVQQKTKNDNDDREQGLENIKFYFKKEKKTPLVRFIMVKKPTYTLKKKDEKKYILTIEDANIRWPHLELPQFPPRDFRGFTMVMPERKNGRLEISIGVERDSKVTSFTKDNEVWLKIEGY